MNSTENKVNESSTLMSELKTSIEKLKSEAKEKYNKNQGLTDDEYELAYARGYYFGQLAALEDCFNLFNILLKTNQKTDKITISILKQQMSVMIKIIDDTSAKVKNNEPIEELINSVQGVISLIKKNLENLNNG